MLTLTEIQREPQSSLSILNIENTARSLSDRSIQPLTCAPLCPSCCAVAHTVHREEALR